MSEKNISDVLVNANLLQDFVNNHLNNPEVFLDSSDSNLNLRNDLTNVIKHLFDNGISILITLLFIAFLLTCSISCNF